MNYVQDFARMRARIRGRRQKVSLAVGAGWMVRDVPGRVRGAALCGTVNDEALWDVQDVQDRVPRQGHVIDEYEERGRGID